MDESAGRYQRLFLVVVWSRSCFGGIVIWIGIAIMALPILSGWRWEALTSPVFVILLLTRVSGITMLEARAKERWGDKAESRTCAKNSPVPIPCPPKSLGRRPGAIGEADSPNAETVAFSERLLHSSC